MPDIKTGDALKIKKAEISAKETTPPDRFSQGSVLKEMESHGLGTQATRAQILQILYNRGYLIGRSIEVTELGLKLSDVLEKDVSEVVSEKLTRYFEDLTNSIEEGKETRENVMKEAETQITKICREFQKKESRIGKNLTEAVIATQDKQSILGTCNKCGGTLKVHKMWKTGNRFVGCTGYKKCGVGYPLPREGVIMNTEKMCESCKTTTIQVHQSGRRPFRMCLDPLCETKKDWLDKKKLKSGVATKKAR